jgi:hypothetical protein
LRQVCADKAPQAPIAVGLVREFVWDGKDHDGKGYYYLQTGDTLNLVTRVPTFAPHPAQQ